MFSLSGQSSAVAMPGGGAVVGNSGATVGRGGVIAPSTTSADPGATAGAAAVAATVLLSPSMGCALAQSAPLHPA